MIESRLRAIENGQTAMNGALGLILDTLQVQTNLLRELAEYARDEPGPSPMIKTLTTLSDAVIQMGVSTDTMSQKFDDLPGVIAAIFETSMDDAAPGGQRGEGA
jgi:hypothetical protein